MSLDLNNLKEQIQTIMEAANTTTATRDLSSGLQTRVQGIFKINPGRLPIQHTQYPYVTCYVDRKRIEPGSIGRDQLTAKRKGEIDVKIVGAVANSVFTTGIDVDEADNDCESLMENIEEILRANVTVNSLTTWSFPDAVTYHNVALDEESMLRAGVLNLRAHFWY